MTEMAQDAQQMALVLASYTPKRDLVDHLLLMMGVGLLGLAALVVIALAMLRGRSARTA
jgi:hypothetical protein